VNLTAIGAMISNRENMKEWRNVCPVRHRVYYRSALCSHETEFVPSDPQNRQAVYDLLFIPACAQDHGRGRAGRVYLEGEVITGRIRNQRAL